VSSHATWAYSRISPPSRSRRSLRHFALVAMDAHDRQAGLLQSTGEWSIYWASSRTSELALPPVAGHFSDGVGMFYSTESYEGREIAGKSLSGTSGRTSLRPQPGGKAFSPDNGQTTETNWTADFTRAGDRGIP
jgi:hypothetical protein